MTNWQRAHERHHAWLRLLQLADELQDIADEWLRHDAELREIEQISTCSPHQCELPFNWPPDLGDDQPF